jgi:hypothetical protein
MLTPNSLHAIALRVAHVRYTAHFSRVMPNGNGNGRHVAASNGDSPRGVYFDRDLGLVWSRVSTGKQLRIRDFLNDDDLQASIAEFFQELDVHDPIRHDDEPPSPARILRLMV